MKESSLRDYFASAPGWQRQLAQLRKKCLAGYADGVIRLQDATLEECRAAEGLLGRHFVPPQLRYKVSDFEKALRDSRFAVANLAEFWQQLDGAPLRSHARQKTERQQEVHRFFAEEAALPHGEAARSWLQAMEEQKSHGFGILQDRIGQPEAARWLHWVCCTLDRRQQHAEPEELALCSYAVSTDPHALDGKNPAGSLLLHALAFWQQVPLPTRARQRLALLRRCGLMQDDISDFTVQRGLILTGADGREHPAWAQLRQAGKFCLLTSSQLGEITGAASPTGRVYLLENQMLFSSLCRKSRLQHPLVCTSGQLKEAFPAVAVLLTESQKSPGLQRPDPVVNRLLGQRVKIADGLLCALAQIAKRIENQKLVIGESPLPAPAAVDFPEMNHGKTDFPKKRFCGLCHCFFSPK